MPRYIDADKVIEIIKNYGKGAVSERRMTLDAVDDIVYLAQAIDYIPVADVAEVKHGKWIATDEYMTDECSMCGTHIQIEDFEECSYSPKCGIVKLNYCPHCGAKMGGKDESI